MLLTTCLCAASLLAEQNNGQESPLAAQLKINRAALLNPSMEEQIRIDTALELLRNEDGQARAILLEVLTAKDNAAAQMIVCKAIIQSRGWDEAIIQPKEFLEPLMAILTEQEGDVAKIAAKASLIFPYSQVQPYLMRIIENPELPMQARLNAVYAMQIRPDKEAVSQLLIMLDSEDKQISSAAKEALLVWLPLATDEQSWRKNLSKLERMSRVEILKEWVIAQDGRIRQIEEQLKNYRQLYTAAQNKIFEGIADNKEKAGFLAGQLVSEYSDIKLWAIDKISVWLKSGSEVPLEVLTEPLMGLISDEEVSVRLATAKLLSQLSNVNSADKLFAQLKIESAPEVRKELLTALSQVCNYAFSPGADFNDVDAQIRSDALEIASKYFDGDAGFAAEVVRKLLLQNGLEKEQAEKYFKLIAESFRKEQTDKQLQGQLLSEMSRLCSQDSFYRQAASEIFGDIFLKAIDDENTIISEPAVVGFIKTDRSRAFQLLLEKGFASHPSEKIRKAVISLASQVGSQNDMEWLFAKATSSGVDMEEDDLAWDAIANLSKNCSATYIVQWTDKYDAVLSDAAVGVKNKRQKILSLLETAEKKATDEGSKQLICIIRAKLARGYEKNKQYDIAAKYYGLLLIESNDPNERDVLAGDILWVHLEAGQFEQAKQLIDNRLLSKDLSDVNDLVVTIIKKYLGQANEAESSALVEALRAIKIENPRPLWQQQLSKWASLTSVSEPNNPE